MDRHHHHDAGHAANRHEAHGHGAPGSAVRLAPFSMLLLPASARLLVAFGLCGLLWATTYWAMAI